MKPFLKIFYLSILLLCCNNAASQTIQEKIVNYYTQIPQEKIFLHTDKSNYIAGDSVWFRGYLMNAVTNRQSLLSYYMYVDLIDAANGKNLSHSMILCDSVGIFDNAIALPSTLQSGTYIISAYTNYMRNFPDDKFFRKYIKVTGLKWESQLENKNKLNALIARSSSKSADKKKVKIQKPFDLRVMPEGGNLIAGIRQLVAFKAVGTDGLGTDVSVKIYDETNKIYAKAKSSHLGMGKLFICAPTGIPLFIEATASNGEQVCQKLPDALPSGITVTAYQLYDTLFVKPLYSEGFDLNGLSFVIHGSLNIAVGATISGKKLKIPTSNLHEGVTLISIIDKATNAVVAERAVYIRKKHNSSDTNSISLSDSSNVNNNLVKTFINAPAGTYSLSVTDANSTIVDTLQDNIVSSLLLSAEVKGFVEKPQYYFKDVTPQVDSNLDVLMLTQAWRRYDISDILNAKKPKATYPIEQSQSIEGNIGGIWKKNMKTPSLLIMCRSPKFTKIIDLEKSGHFSIDGLQFPDSTQFLIAALNHKGKTSFMDLVISDPDIPEIQLPQYKIKEFETDADDSFSYLRAAHIRNLNIVNLPELEIRGNIREKPINQFGLIPDRALNADNEWLKNFNTIEEIFYYFNANMTVSEYGQEQFAGVVYVDEFLYEPEYVSSLQPQDIERVEYISPHNPSAMLFSDINGSSQTATTHGVICIKLKTYSSSSRNTGKHAFATKVVSPLGFKQDVEFYSPKYDTAAKQQSATSDIRTTVYWNPRVTVGENGKAELEFYLPDNPVKLHFDLQGISPTQGPVAITH